MRKIKHKGKTLVIAAIAALAIVLSGTFAWFTAADSITNTLKMFTGESSITVTETKWDPEKDLTPEWRKDKNPAIMSQSINTPIVVRMMITEEWTFTSNENGTGEEVAAPVYNQGIVSFSKAYVQDKSSYANIQDMQNKKWLLGASSWEKDANGNVSTPVGGMNGWFYYSDVLVNYGDTTDELFGSIQINKEAYQNAFKDLPENCYPQLNIIVTAEALPIKTDSDAEQVKDQWGTDAGEQLVEAWKTQVSNNNK